MPVTYILNMADLHIKNALLQEKRANISHLSDEILKIEENFKRLNSQYSDKLAELRSKLDKLSEPNLTYDQVNNLKEDVNKLKEECVSKSEDIKLFVIRIRNINEELATLLEQVRHL